ncbi:hypothetical protein HDE_11165 [Halotydeus destructor]|nr:hypothetical protein HDE_11165 [Halotydeus destructor]
MLLTALCCSSQLFDVLNEYFNYETVTRVALRRPYTIRPPSLVMCLTLVSLIPKYEKRDLTVKDMFDATPKTAGLIYNCTYLEHNSYELSALEGEIECAKYFDTTKYIKQRYVCYSFDLKDSIDDFQVHHVTNGLHAPRFYKIKLRSEFIGAPYFYLHVTNHRLRDHGKSQSFTEQFRSLNESGYGDDNYVTLTYKSFHSNKLPSPYDTNCKDYSKDPKFESANDCFEYCVRNSIVQAIGKLPFSVAIYDEAELPLITKQQLKNGTIRQTLDGAEKLCTKKCASASCTSIDYTPVVISSAGQDRPFLDLYITNEPETIVDYLAKQSMIDVTVYVLSCIGFWFGFSPFLAMIGVEKHIRLKFNRAKQPLFHGNIISKEDQRWSKGTKVNARSLFQTQHLRRTVEFSKYSSKYI